MNPNLTPNLEWESEKKGVVWAEKTSAEHRARAKAVTSRQGGKGKGDNVEAGTGSASRASMSYFHLRTKCSTALCPAHANSSTSNLQPPPHLRLYAARDVFFPQVLQMDGNLGLCMLDKHSTTDLLLPSRFLLLVSLEREREGEGGGIVQLTQASWPRIM